jgi:PAS domain S-box-containing protein
MSKDKIDILLVDDRPENLIALEAVLKSPQYNLIKACSGNEALKYLLDNDCALILMDVQMPGIDGFETAEYIKKGERSKYIPIIFITAINKDERFVHLGYKTGAVDYIFKPFEPEILKSKVDVFVELYKSKLQIKEQAQRLHESDVRDRERALAQLELRSLRRDQIAQKKYRELVDGINHGIIWAADAQTLSFSFVSDTAERLLGFPSELWYSDAGFLGKNVHPDDHEIFQRALRSARLNKDVSLEHRLIKSDGSVAWFHTGMRLAPKADTEDFELRGLSIDISDMKEAEEALRKSEERASLLAEASLILSEAFDSDNQLSRIGELLVPKYADWLSIKILDERNVLRCLTVAHLDKKIFRLNFDRENLTEDHNSFGVRKVIATGKSEVYAHVSEEDLKVICLNEESTKYVANLGPASATIVPLQSRGKTLGAMTLISSVDSQKQDHTDLAMIEDLARRAAIAIDNANLYKQAQEAVRARDEFLSVASHELKTPLTPLRLHTQSMKRALDRGTFAEFTPDKLKRVIETSDKQIARLAQLIDDLLDISRINIGQLNLNLEKFSLAEMAREIVERYSGEASIAKCTIELQIKSEAVGYWDRFRTEQIVTNLLTNAIKYGAAKPITVQVAEENNTATITVRDEGIGIEKKDQNRIFERFERAVSPYSFRGLGLGLFIVRELVNMHFGDIRVESAVGKGSSFIVDLPTDLVTKDVGLNVLNTANIRVLSH